MPDLIYSYPSLYPGILLKRYKRFFADVELATGEIVTAHCPNTGSMTGICQPGSQVQLSYSNLASRKLPYTWIISQVCDNEPTWVGVNTLLSTETEIITQPFKKIPRLQQISPIEGCVIIYSHPLTKSNYQASSRKISVAIRQLQPNSI